MTWKKTLLPALSLVAILTVVSAFAAHVSGLDRRALWQVVQACVADFELTGAAAPCLQIDLDGGREAGVVVMQPPLLNDMIVVPTRKLVGVEDAFLQQPDAPNYFAAAWRARSLLVKRDGRTPDWDEVGLVVNPSMVRSQDQMHIHVGCLLPDVRNALENMAPKVPTTGWSKLPVIIPHIVFWGRRVESPSLEGVAPFRLAAEGLADRVTERARLTVMVAGVRVSGADQFLILASYAGAPHSWWPIGAERLVDTGCPAWKSDPVAFRR